MGVDHPKGGVLLLQIGHDRCDDRMLEDVGEISGMEDVAVVHGKIACLRAQKEEIQLTGTTGGTRAFPI